MTTLPLSRRALVLGTPALALGATLAAGPAGAQALRGGTMRVGIVGDIVNFDPQQFSAVNFPIIKNLYDSLLEYTPEGRAIPSLASAWTIAPDNRSVTIQLRTDVRFHSGAPLTAESLIPTFVKANDPQRGRNVFPTMSIVQGWAATGPHTFRVDFRAPVPERQITDLLQFMAIIDPAGMDTVDARPAGTGAYMLGERVVGQRLRLVANPNYWRQGEPVCRELLITVFTEDQAAASALESGSVDIVFGITGRNGVRLRNAGYQLIQGPGPLVQVFRINTTRGPFRNASFRQAFNFLMDREGMLRVGYAGLGQVTATPWPPSSPAFDAEYNTRFAFNLDRARALLDASGLTPAQRSEWRILVNGGDQPSVQLSQILQATLQRVGINVELEVRQGAEYVDAILSGRFDTTFGAIGNVQKFPTRVATNSIYRTTNNPVLGHPHPHPEYVAAIDAVNAALTPEAQRTALATLNRVLAEVAFAIPTNTYDFALTVAARNVAGWTLDMDNMLVARTLGFRA
jgi:peptide/nickel transport system substrate-binding protein